MSLPEQQDLEGGLQNLTLNPPPPTAQPEPSDGAPDLEELHPSLEPLRKHISPAWKDVTEDSDVEDATETNDYIIYHYNYYVQHGITHDRLRDQFCDDFYGWTTAMWDKATKPIRSHARDFLINNGVPLDINMRKIGDKLVTLMQQNHAALTTAYLESLRRSDSQLDSNHPANRPESPLSYYTATQTEARQPASVHAPSVNTPPVHVPASANSSTTCTSTTPREKENLSDEDPSADDPVKEGSSADAILAISAVTSIDPATDGVLDPPHRRREAATLPDKDWRSDDPATNEGPLTNTNRHLDEDIAKLHDEDSDVTFEESIRIDKKATTAHRNGNYGAQPLAAKQERRKEKNLRGEFAPAYQRTLSSLWIIWVEQLALMINTLIRHLWTHRRLVERRVP
ncbi:hypothetical protein E4U56_007492 [Claviceps arundinis]|uniref:Uncharacterized protein n=1 Tax=Claviceps arundinis TaxID=1623583 RepID=A0A9P7SM62_9HYPO|nr:hypothetical protein E4U56_007492 [Claviceps arundinis]